MITTMFDRRKEYKKYKMEKTKTKKKKKKLKRLRLFSISNHSICQILLKITGIIYVHIYKYGINYIDLDIIFLYILIRKNSKALCVVTRITFFINIYIYFFSPNERKALY